jgi:integrase
MKTLKNDSNTIRSSVKRIHVVLNHLVKNKIIAVNPIKGFQVKGESSKRVYLSPEELESFEILVAKGRLYNIERRSVYNYFLFSCYTGLRFSDIRDLEFKDIIITEKGSYIHLKMQKTKEVITIPLTKKAKALIKNYKNGNESVFKVYASQKTNTILRELIADAGIEKHISFHCARHTFATLALNKDMPLAAIQKLLGHNSVKTTQLYSKIMDMTIFKEMEKME